MAKKVVTKKRESKVVERVAEKVRQEKPEKARNVELAGKAVAEFLKKTLNVDNAKVIKVTKVEDGWENEAEVYEESSFIKSLGLPTRVQDRNTYSVKLDGNLEVQSYGRKEKPKETE